MSKKNRERRGGEPGAGPTESGNGAGGIAWLPVGLSAVALLLGFMAWTDARSFKSDMGKRIAELDSKMIQVQKDVQSAAKARPAAQQGPDPDKVYTVRTEGSPFKGNASAPIVIAEFSEYQCPFCARVGPTMSQIHKVYGDQVKVVWKNLPLSFHPNAVPAALAAMAANEQGKFWEMHDLLFANQQKLNRDQFLAHAKELGLDIPKFTEAYDKAKYKAQIDADSADAKALGVQGTPGFFVNGKFLSGAKPFEEFAAVINAELKRLNLPIPPGAPQS